MMPKRRSALSDLQMVFSFDAPAPAREAGDLAGFDAILSASVARMLREDGRSRAVIAAQVSALLNRPVTMAMLNVYASESHTDHNVPASRWLAIVAATGRYDVADAIVKHIGCRILSGDEIKAAELGHLQAEKDALDARIRALRGEARPIARGIGERR